MGGSFWAGYEVARKAIRRGRGCRLESTAAKPVAGQGEGELGVSKELTWQEKQTLGALYRQAVLDAISEKEKKRLSTSELRLTLSQLDAWYEQEVGE